MNRLSDILNGLGTLVHHSAASFIVVMLVVGAIPPSRYILNPCLILVLQHWVVLLVYASPALYSAIELGLEYYFNLIVFCKFDVERICNCGTACAQSMCSLTFIHYS